MFAVAMSEGEIWRGRWRRFLGMAVVAVALAHALLVWRFAGRADLLGPEPFYPVDYALHYAYALEAGHYLPHLRLWGYNPYFLAGYPSLLFDAPGNRLTALVVASAPVAPAVAFKLWIVLGFLVAPLLAAAAGRALGLELLECAILLLLTVGYWQFDATAYLYRRIGVFSFLLASFAIPLALAVVARLAQTPRIRGAVSAGLALALLLALHPLAALPVAAGAAAATAVTRERSRALVALASAGVLAVALNVWWILPALRYRGDFASAHLFGQTSVASLAGNSWLAPGHAILVLLVVLAPAGIARIWRRGAGEAASAAAAAGAIAAALVLAAAGSQLGAGGLEPLRYLLPLGVVAAAPAAAALVGFRLRRPSHLAYAGATVAVLAVPFAVVPGYAALEPNARLGYLVTRETEAAYALLDAVRTETTAAARIVVERPARSELFPFRSHFLSLLPAWTGCELLNGPTSFVPTVYGGVDLVGGILGGREIASLDDDALEETLARYNVGWIAVLTPGLERRLDANPEYYRRVRDLNGLVLYARRAPPSWFLEGSGEVTAAYDRIEVRGASPGGVVLKYHWFGRLRTEPPLPLARAEVPGDPAGFIRVANGAVRDFAIVNPP